METIRLNKSHFIYIVGMSFFWTLPRRSYFQYLFSEWGQTALEQQMYYFIYLFIIVILGMIVALLSFYAPRSIRIKNQWLFMLMLLGSFGGVCIYFAPRIAIFSSAIAAMGAIACAAGFVALTIAWGAQTFKLQGKEMLLCSVLAFLLSFILLTTTSFPNPIPAILPIAAPMISGLFWYFYSKSSSQGLTFRTPIDVTYSVLKGRLPFGMIGILVLALLIGGVLRGFVYPGSFNDGPVMGPILVNFLSIGLAVLLCLSILFSSHREKLFYSMWIVLISVFLAGSLLMSTIHPELSDFGKAVIIVGRSYLSFFLWVTLLTSAQQAKLPLTFLLGVFYLIPEALASSLSYFLIPSIMNTTSFSFNDYVGVFSIISSLLLIMASLLFLRNRAFQKDDLENNSDSQRKNAIDELGDESGLTNREKEIMLLVSQGNGVKKIAELLYVSPGTVQTHQKRIYRKMELHSKQDLIDLVAKRLVDR